MINWAIFGDLLGLGGGSAAAVVDGQTVDSDQYARVAFSETVYNRMGADETTYNRTGASDITYARP